MIKWQDFPPGYFIFLKGPRLCHAYIFSALCQHILHMVLMRMKSGCFLLPSYAILIPAHYRVALAGPGGVFPLPLGSRRKTRGMSSSWWAKQFCTPWQWDSCCTPVLLPTFQVLELAGSKTELTCTYQAACSDAPNASEWKVSLVWLFLLRFFSLHARRSLRKRSMLVRSCRNLFSTKSFLTHQRVTFTQDVMSEFDFLSLGLSGPPYKLHCSRWHDLGSLALKTIQASFTKNFQTPAVAFRCSFWVIK